MSILVRTDVSAEVSVLLERDNTSAFLAVRMSEGGCGVAKATGAFLWLDSRGFYNITTDLGMETQSCLYTGRLLAVCILGDYWLYTGILLAVYWDITGCVLGDYCFILGNYWLLYWEITAFILGDYWLYTGSLLYSVTYAVQCFNRPHQGKLCFPLMLQFQGWLGWLCPRLFILPFKNVWYTTSHFCSFFQAGKEQVLSEVFPVKLKVWYTLQLASKVCYTFHSLMHSFQCVLSKISHSSL